MIDYYSLEEHNTGKFRHCKVFWKMQGIETFSAAPPRGMRDLLAAEVALRDWASSVILRTYEKYGFTHIETPALENIKLLRGAEGGENLKLIFEVLKRGEKLDKELKAGNINRNELVDLGLRFDLTVPLVRFFAHNQANLPSPFKSIQIGPVWRAESPQQGRYRQFTQCDIDTIGVKSEIAEMELLQASSEALMLLGFQDFTIRINDRRILAGLAESCGFARDRFDNVFIALDKLDKISVTGVRHELENDGHSASAIASLVKVLDSNKDGSFEPSAMRSIITGVPEEVYNALSKVMEAIRRQSAGHYHIVFDPALVRGMGYYTGQIFEIVCPGYSHSVGGGGRYDKMIGKFTGRDVPAVGFSFGFERIINILMERNFVPPDTVKRVALITESDRDNPADVLAAAQTLREKGHIVSIQPRKKDMRKQLDALAQHGFSSFCVYKTGSVELEIKDLAIDS